MRLYAICGFITVLLSGCVVFMFNAIMHTPYVTVVDKPPSVVICSQNTQVYVVPGNEDNSTDIVSGSGVVIKTNDAELTDNIGNTISVEQPISEDIESNTGSYFSGKNVNCYAYVITDSDTLCSISARFNCPVDVLVKYNDIRDVNLIYTGSILLIPQRMPK